MDDGQPNRDAEGDTSLKLVVMDDESNLGQTLTGMAKTLLSALQPSVERARTGMLPSSRLLSVRS
jgi:hypothetical protein